jgi:UDP-N-acetylglucosamine 4,6-dehydratase
VVFKDKKLNKLIDSSIHMFNGAVILITGGTGSWGNELTKQLLEKYNPKEIRIYSRGEHKQVQMKIKFSNEKRIKYYIGDVRDKNRLSIASKEVDYIFHLAALKHVPVCEENPWESVLTNIYGTRNVIECAIENNVKKVIDVSTDKAVDPFNLYGVCKACGEKMIISANTESDKTSFVCVRGGNVIGTNGSVVPLFKEQIKKNNEITITDEKMSRFFFPLPNAINLIFRAAIDSVGGEIFVMKMPSVKITDLAEVMIEELGNNQTKIRNIGVRPGEKFYEVLVSKYETPKCIESGDYFIILPHISIPKIVEKYANIIPLDMPEFNSENNTFLTKEEIKAILNREGWLKDNPSDDNTYYGKKLSDSELKNIFKIEGWQKNHSD